MLREAHDAFARGDAAGALSLIDKIAERFPAGRLGQEREALAIEALARAGRTSEASARARAFLSMHRDSPHAARVTTFAK
jgi:hypothetical protein